MFNKAVERYDKVLAILDWGREEWHGVSDENRGVVFQDTFIRGIRLLRLQAYRQVNGVCVAVARHLYSLLMCHTF
ncbi:hypothetical protein PENSPDRAFT_593743 [Peniophora sp. CONT]|nr:hypothetical protein PENSPDRAFT_593743 [Peniophora sp. CONT]